MQIENRVSFKFNFIQFAIKSSIKHCSCVLYFHSATNSVWTTCPARIYKPAFCFVLFNFLSE